MSTVPSCKHCNKKKTVKLRKQYAANGAEQYMWYCLACDKPVDSQRPFIKKSLVISWVKQGRLPSFESVPVVNDYRDNAACVVCGAIGAEWHHWLPQCFYDDVDNHVDWPGAYLCKPCHDEWHEIVTWYLPGRTGTERSNIVKMRYFPNGNGNVQT